MPRGNMSSTDNSLDYETLIKNKEPIDIKDPAYEQIFKDLQGGTIKSYGRKYSLHLFIQFDPNKVDEVNQWIQDEIASSVTSTWKQLEHTETFKKMREQDSSFSGELCKNFLLSYQGYRTLGFVPDKNEVSNLDTEFKTGMKQYWELNYRLENPPKDYWYNPPENWDVGKDRIDALILLAHDSLEELKNEANAIIGRCETLGRAVACEAGYRMKTPDGKYVGSFGFADGVSQPLFLKSDYDKYCEKQDIKQWDPKASLNLVLSKDPFGEPYSYGSYCVWQKLETNYQSFEDKVGELAGKLGCDRERASALVIGRFKDGTPLALSDRPNQNDGSAIANDFNYADDLNGGKCPIQAHIRKLNPRKDEDSASQEKSRRNSRILRAGTTYFNDPKAQETPQLSIIQLCLNRLEHLDKVSKQSLADKIKSVSGLLFVCFQHSILSQFSKLQGEWADDRQFPRNAEPKYIEPIIGHPATVSFNELPKPQDWPKEWDGKERQEFGFWGCVKLRGGEFFFAPSISFLKNGIRR